MLDQQITDAQARKTRIERERGERRSALAALRTGDKTKDPVKKVPQPTIQERLLKEPEFQVLFLANQRAELNARYGALFRQLHLSPEKAEAFKDIAARREEQSMDVQAIMREKKVGHEDPGIAQSWQQINTTYQNEMRRLLGDTDYQKFQDFDHTTQARNIVSGLAGGSVTVLREPLTAEQSEQLVQIMATTKTGPSAAAEMDWDAIDTKAQAILSPTQFAYFKTQEPPLPTGGRFQNLFQRSVRQAIATK